MKEVSLYIPCFNAAQTLAGCLEAVLRQSHPLKSVLVIDDGSTDETEEIALRYPVKVIKHGKNLGLAAARNTAIKNINTEFIASVDADCFPEPGWLGLLMEKFNSLLQAGAGGRLEEKNSSSQFDSWRSAHMKQYWDNPKVKPKFIFGSNTVFRRKAIVEAGLYDETLRNNYEDVDICERLAKRGYALAYEEKARAWHLKKDNLGTLLNAYWNWNFNYNKKEGHYDNHKRFILKIKDNLGLANRYIEEDSLANRHQLIYLDFLLGLHTSLRDLEYYLSQGQALKGIEGKPVALWLSLFDLTLFSHLAPGKGKRTTIIAKENAFPQNFSALVLILRKFTNKFFKSPAFKKSFCQSLVFSVTKINNPYLLERLVNLVESHHDWESLIEGGEPNLDKTFLETICDDLDKWFERLVRRFPGLIRQLELQAEAAIN